MKFQLKTNNHNLFKSKLLIEKPRFLISYLSIFILLFVFSAFFYSFNNPILSSKATEQQVSISVLPVLSLALESNNSHIQLLSSNSVYSTSNKAIVSTNNSKGYNLSISSVDNSTDLNHENPLVSSKFISISQNTLKNSIPSNQWGFSLNDINYLPINKLTSPAVIKDTGRPVSAEETPFYFAAKANDSMLSGRYQKELTITAIVNPSRSTITSISTMQEMTPEICSNTTTPYAFINGVGSGEIVKETTRIDSNNRNLVPEAELEDIRDGKKYVIRKLADGNCWMVQNLDLGDTYVQLTQDNTDLNSGESFILSGAPAGSSSDSDYWGNADSFKIYNPGNQWLVNIEEYQSEQATDIEPADPEMKLRHLGNYYNWFAATAGSGKYDPVGPNTATSSICPKGWKLPPAISTGGYAYLASAYHIGHTIDPDDAIKMRRKPFSFALPGEYDYSDGLVKVGRLGSYWSIPNLVDNSDQSPVFWLSDYAAILYSSSVRTNGKSIRCMAKTI